jgi:hypothetical protein
LVARRIPNILCECIEDIKSGKMNIEACLNKYRHLHRQLMPLITIALQIQEPPEVELPDSLWFWGMTAFIK